MSDPFDQYGQIQDENLVQPHPSENPAEVKSLEDAKLVGENYTEQNIPKIRSSFIPPIFQAIIKALENLKSVEK